MKSEYAERNRFVVAQERQHAIAVANHGGTLGHLTVEAAQLASHTMHRVAGWLHEHHVFGSGEDAAVAIATVTPISAARSYQGSTAAMAGAEAFAAERGE